MSTTVTITTGSAQTIYADTADTRYIIQQYVDIVPSDPYADAIDASSSAANRTFEINGHIAGNRGIELGNENNSVLSGKIVIGATGLVDSSYLGISAETDHGVIVNHGTIEGGIHAIMAHGTDLSINNTGAINAQISAIDFGGKDAQLTNSGTISANYGVFFDTSAKQSSTLINTGVITGSNGGAVFGCDASDTVINSGTLNGDVTLAANDDRYEGKGGVINGLVDGGMGNDVLRGGGKADHFAGGAGHDVLTGCGGGDVFIFASKFDADTVTDFHASGKNHDLVDLSDMRGFDSFADLAGHMRQDGQDTVLNFGHGDVLTLHDVDLGALSKSDFLF